MRVGRMGMTSEGNGAFVWLMMLIILLMMCTCAVDSAPLVTDDITCCSPNMTCDFVQYGNRLIREGSRHFLIQIDPGSPYADCVTLCIDYTGFVCLSASYQEANGTCWLSRDNLQSAGASLEGDTEWQYFNMDRSTCGPATCAIPIIANGVTNPSTAEIPYSTQVVITCDPGYEVSGESVLTCVNADTYDFAPPTCEVVSCGTAPVYPDMTADQTGPLDYSQTATYTCNQGYYKTTTENVVCGPTGTWTENTVPVCSEVLCAEPAVPNGVVTSTGPYPDQSTVTIECEAGFTFLAGDLTLLCDASGGSPTGTWVGTLPTCDYIQCTAPVVQDATVDPPNGPFGLGDTITYTCDTGYSVTQGSPTLTCQVDSTWDLTPITCDINSCPDQTMQTGVLGFDGGYVYDEQPPLTCAPGYREITLSTLICGPDGTWLGDPLVCEQNECVPPSIPDSTFTQAGPYYDTDSVTVVCDAGYERTSGNEQLVCDATLNPGTWIGTIPECNRVQCPLTDVPNSSIDPAAPHYYQDTITFTCSAGYRMTGSPTMTCQADTTWDVPPPTCTVNSCPDIPMLVGVEGFIGGYIYQDEPTLSCGVGYHQITPSTLICGDGGIWEGTPIVCEQTVCSLPTIPDSTPNQPAPYYHTDEVTVVCDAGYEIVSGNDIIVCDATSNPGTWTGSLPACDRRQCPTITIPDSVISPPGPFYYTDTVSYTCTSGYNLTGFATLTCQADESWDHQVPYCSRNRCPDRPMQFGIDGFTGGYVSFDSPTLTCTLGYHMIQSSTLECNEWGQWIGSPPICDRTECASPTITNSMISPPAPYYNNDKITVTCDNGYKLASGSTTLSCDASASPGVWVGNIPVCSLVTCMAKDIPYGTYDGFPSTNFGLDDRITYTCDKGHELIGSTQLVCLSTERWTNPEPSCQPYRCPSEPVDGGTISSVGPYLWNNKITYICDIGYNISGDASRNCGPMGQWESPAPICVPNQCVIPASSGIRAVESGPYLYGDRVDLRCSDDTKYIDGWEFVVCDQYGAWDREVPLCKKYMCAELKINNGSTVGTKPPYHVGDTVKLQCTHDMMIQGRSSLTCVAPDSGDKGVWDGEPPTCKSVAAERLNQFEGKDKWLNWFLPVLAAAALAAAIGACCCWFFCCGARKRRRKHADDCDCEDCESRPATPIKEERVISRPPSPVPQPQPRHTHVTPSPCVGAVCTTKHAPHSHSSCGMVGGTCGGPPPAYSPHRHHSIHPLGCGISPGYHHDAYMGLNTMPMMMHAPIQYGQTTMVPVHGHSYSNQGFVNHRGPVFKRRPSTPHSSIDSGPEPEGNCVHGIPTGVCKICIPTRSGGMIMVQPALNEKRVDPAGLPPIHNKKAQNSGKCYHGIKKIDCDVCGPRCVHGEPQRQCKRCELCPHNENPSTCQVCILERCPHGKARAGICGLCKQGLCPHGKDRALCTFCSELKCNHGKNIETCSKCRKCEHGKTITSCRFCKDKLPKGRRNSLSGDPDGETGMKFLEKSSRAKSESNIFGKLDEAKRVPAAAKKLKLPDKAAWMPHSNGVRTDANHMYTSTR